MHAHVKRNPGASSFVLVAILVGTMIHGSAWGQDSQHSRALPGTLEVLEEGGAPPYAGFFIDEPRLNYYLDMEMELFDTSARLNLVLRVDERELAYIESLEKRVRQLDRPWRSPALWLGVGAGLAVVILALGGVAIRSFTVALGD